MFMVSYNHEMDPEAAIEYKKVLKELDDLRCFAGGAKKNFSTENCTLNNQERFNSIYCFSCPLYLQIELTNKCNLKCIQCGVIKRKEATLPASVFQKLLKMLPYIGGITWLGGEVFLVDYFLNLISTIHLDFPHVGHTIYTNGLLIDQKIASALSDIDTLRLKFSVDSVVKETYEQIRSSGKFEILLNNLLTLNEVYKQKNKKPNLGINVIAMKTNIEQLVLYPDFCKKYGINHLDVSFLADDADPPHLPEENIFSNIEQAVLERAKSILLEIETKCHEYGIRFYCNFNSFIDQAENSVSEDIDLRKKYNSTIVTEQTKTGLKHVFQCYYPWTSLYIKCNGLVVPTGDCTIPVGNILRDDLPDIWNGRVMQAYRYKLAHSDLSKWCSLHCQQKLKVNKLLLGVPGGG